MLVLTRKPSERVLIGRDIVVTVVRIDGNKVRIGIEAPRDLSIRREEIRPRTTFEHSPEELVTV